MRATSAASTRRRSSDGGPSPSLGFISDHLPPEPTAEYLLDPMDMLGMSAGSTPRSSGRIGAEI